MQHVHVFGTIQLSVHALLILLNLHAFKLKHEVLKPIPSRPSALKIMFPLPFDLFLKIQQFHGLLYYRFASFTTPHQNV